VLPLTEPRIKKENSWNQEAPEPNEQKKRKNLRFFSG
jgi:hypothetical protein